MFDSKVLHLLRDEYRIKRVTKVRADTLEELVAKLDGVERRQGARDDQGATTPRCRRTCRSIPTSRTAAARTGCAIPKSNWANTLDTPPFEAYAVTCGITFTFGGLKIDGTRARDRHRRRRSIPGLYAAGELVGGLFYFNYPGGTGLMNGAVFGKIAGTSAGQRAEQQP